MKIKPKFTVDDLMTRSIVAARCDDLLCDAIKTMDDESVAAIPVVNKYGKLCGILSLSDLLRDMYNLQADISVLPIVSDVVRKSLLEALGKDNNNRTVADAMTTVVKTIDRQTRIEVAAAALIDNDIHHLLITDEQAVPVGILSTTDIVRAVAYHMED